jgi:uncharacterized protein YmfQ (DUF2313 family)
MLAPYLLAQDFARALRNLLPRGRAWSRDDDTTQFATLMGLSPTYERQTNRGNNLLVDSFPATTLELLPEWEASLGLPDPCAGTSPTIAARRAQVVARFAALGGQSVAFYVAFAAQLGYTISVEQFAPFRAGFSRAGDPLRGVDWFYAWSIHSPLNTINYFRAGVDAAGEPLAFWSNTVLECEMQDVKPAHTILFFSYP